MAGQLRVDEITDEAGTGSPSFPQKITPSSLGTGTPTAAKVLNGAGEWVDGTSPGELLLLQEDTFTTSGTFTKATGFDDDDTVMIFLVGGGASGGAVRLSSANPHGVAAGGTGGACAIIIGKYSEVPTTSWDFTAGAGGAAVSATTDSSFEPNSPGGESSLSNSTSFSKFIAAGGRGNVNGSARVQNTAAAIGYYGGGASQVSVFTPNGAGQVDNRSNLAGLPGGDRSGKWFIAQNGCRGAQSSTELTVSDITNRFAPSYQVIGSGGSAARQGATNRTSYNAKVSAFINTGGNGSGTANGQNGTGIGGGGGGCVRPAGTTATPGAGGNGGLIVQYYRGRVSVEQVLGTVGQI